jgi:hypothetical protein
VSVPPESPQANGQPDQPGRQPADPDVTREMPKFTAGPPNPQNPQNPPDAQPSASPWSRGYAGPGPAYPAPPPAYAPPPQQGWPSTPQSQQVWPSASQQQGWPSPRSRRGLWTGVTLVALAIVATLIAVLVSTNSSSPASSASGGTPQQNPPPTLAPSPAPSSTSPQGPGPLPSLGAVTTPPGLLAINYHAYSLTTIAPSDIALGPQELVQFKKYGLSRAVGLRALTLGPTGAGTDDWDADINILQFSSPAAAAAELNYSNSQNKKAATTIALPGLPNATAFVNKGDSSTGIGIGAFTTVGRYQVVVILNGLSENVPTSASVVAAEAAKVMRAVLPDAPTIVPPPSGTGGSGGGGPVVPGFPTPSPTGTHA